MVELSRVLNKMSLTKPLERQGQLPKLQKGKYCWHDVGLCGLHTAWRPAQSKPVVLHCGRRELFIISRSLSLPLGTALCSHGSLGLGALVAEGYCKSPPLW